MLHEEGLDNVFARHRRYGEAVRAAVAHWGLEIISRDPQFHSPVVTTISMPNAKGGDAFRKLVLEKFDVSLGAGLSKLADKIFRIGHIGDTNDLTIIAALAGVEMGLELAGVPHKKGGVQVAMDYFAKAANSPN
jgi:alanine-glyoxylate transaminase / serine-glyoxylate transaminase / serine-pyruvate transaminase